MKLLTVFMSAAVLLSVITVIRASAYYNLGTVTLSLGSSSVSMDAGKSITISATASPASHAETPGCGMPQCPQTCGTTGCADANGQCTCAGGTYATYTANVAVTSGNTAIARAAWSGGVLTITGVSPGTTTIKAQAALREYTSSSEQTITVTVTRASGGVSGSGSTGGSTGGGSAGNAAGGSAGGSAAGGSAGSSAGASAGGSKSTSTGGSTGTSAGGSAAANNTGSAAASASSGTAATTSAALGAASSTSSASSDTSSTSMTGSLGTFDIIQLPENNITGKAELEKIMGKDVTATFQKKDGAGNVEYSWSFKGADVKKPADFNMGISFGGGDEQTIKKQSGLSSLFYLSFAHHGELPGKADVSIRVSSLYQDGENLYFYYYDPDKKTFSLQKRGVKVVNGYADVNITHCSEYFLSSRAIGPAGGFPVWGVVLIVLAVLAADGILFYLFDIRRGGHLPNNLNHFFGRKQTGKTVPSKNGTLREEEPEKEEIF